MRKYWIFAAAAGLVASSSAAALADGNGAVSGYILTGQVKRAESDGTQYTLAHEMVSLPAQKSPQGVRDADVTKRLTLTFPHETSCARVTGLLRGEIERLGFNGASDKQKTATLLSACSGDVVKARSQVVVSYDATTKTTSLWVEGMPSRHVQGIEAMRAVWGVWLGPNAAPKTQSGLVARL